jgi:hypothetical protein
MIWNSKNNTYYDKGKKAYIFGDKLPEEVLNAMGGETLKEYVEKGWISDNVPAVDVKRESLLEKARGYGLKPHPNTGIAKLEAMIADHDALTALREEAFELGIDVSDDLGFADLKDLIDEKKAEDESDS